jgi:Ca-activated chloride channel family protein
MMIFNISYGNSWAWYLMILPILMLLYFIFWQKRATIQTNTSTYFDIKRQTVKLWLRQYLPLLHIIASILLVIAIARPQDEMSREKSNTRGIDIVMAIDVSTSMLERDFSPNRLEAAKEVAAEFVSKRPNDRIGVVVFAGESFTQCPPTIDHSIVLKQIKSIRDGIIDDGTAIGMGLATSVRALRNSNAKSRVCILLTDGVNTAGTIDPNTAIEIARAFKVKVYCIGVGTPRNTILGIDEPLMRRISGITGGLYFRAGSLERLKQIYAQINELETSEIEKNSLHKKTDLFFPYALIALILVLTSILLRSTYLKGVN